MIPEDFKIGQRVKLNYVNVSNTPKHGTVTDNKHPEFTSRFRGCILVLWDDSKTGIASTVHPSNLDHV